MHSYLEMIMPLAAALTVATEGGFIGFLSSNGIANQVSFAF